MTVEDKIEQLKKAILEYAPQLPPYVAQQLAIGYITNPDRMKEIVKRDMKAKKKGKVVASTRGEFKTVYDNAIEIQPQEEVITV
jgi:hypothetical protein